MTDEIDNAQDKQDIGLADAIRKASTGEPAAKATGICLYCYEPVPFGYRWCGGWQCRDDWCKERNRK